VAAPALLAVSDDHGMFAMERLAGGSDVDAAADRAAVRDSLIGNAVALHGLGPLGLPGEPTVRGATLANVALFRDVYDGLSARQPVVEDAFALATGAAPDDDTAPVLVHGDLGPGNFLFRDGVITGLVDWELWHLGDPMDDLASLWFRTCVLRRDGDLTDWFEAYVKAGGASLDADKLRYFRMVSMLRVVVAVLVMQEKDPDRDEAVAGLMLPLLGLTVDEAAGRATHAGLPPI
jgi:aminoglycoside phosphotransferase (APT) family kinase protein